MAHNAFTAGVRTRLLSALLGAGMLACCQTTASSWAEAPPLPVSEAACKQDPDPYYASSRRALQVSDANAGEVLATCGRVVAHPGRATASELANALYFVGASARTLSQIAPQPGPSETTCSEPAQCLDVAKRALDRTLALNDAFHLARLELARVYRLQANVSNLPTRRRDALNEIERLQRDVTDPADAIHAASHFLRAAIYVDLHPAGPELADAALLPTAAAQSADSHEHVLPTLTWASTLRDLAVFTDPALAQNETHRAHPDRADALNWLARYANDLGCFLMPCDASGVAEAWQSPPLTRESVQRAIDYFSSAQQAVDAATYTRYVHPQFLETYVHLGKAKIHMAGLLGAQAIANYGCVAGVGNEAMLNQARADLQTALDQAGADSEAHRAMACAMLALDDAAAAREHADLAASSNSPASRLMLARVQAAQQQWTPAVDNYQLAAAPGLSARARSLIYLERARARLHTPPQQTIEEAAFASATAQQKEDARRDLETATGLNGTNWLARLELGKLYYHLAQQDGAALQQLAAFDAGGPAAAIDEHSVRAQALVVLSRIYSRPPFAHAANAIRTADNAFAIDATWPYREQACLARLRFGRVEFSTSGPRAICSPSDDAPPGEGSLLEGMYHLRRAFLLRAGDREREWEDAFRAFSQGQDAVSNVAVSQELRNRLRYGKGAAQYCIGFAELGNQEIQSIGSEAEIANARAHFAQYGVADCPARR